MQKPKAKLILTIILTLLALLLAACQKESLSKRSNNNRPKQSSEIRFGIRRESIDRKSGLIFSKYADWHPKYALKRLRKQGSNVEEKTVVWAYDKALIDLSKKNSTIDSIIVPKNAKIRTKSSSNNIQIYLEKKLDFAAHSRKHIADERKSMGIASKVDGKTLTIATYGERDPSERWREISLLLIVPKAISVKKQDGLSGENSPISEYFDRSKWKTITTEVDTDLTSRDTVFETKKRNIIVKFKSKVRIWGCNACHYVLGEHKPPSTESKKEK